MLDVHSARTETRVAYVLVAAFLAALIAANLITAKFGPAASVYTAFVLIAADLVVRDALHDRLAGWARWAVMGALVLTGGTIAYVINADAAQIALASAAAFAAALTVDALIYHAARRLPWLERSNLSNIVASIIDSAVFVAVAFPGFLWSIAVGQTTAKIAGGLIVALLLQRLIAVRTYPRQKQ